MALLRREPIRHEPVADRQFIIYLIILIVFGLLSLSSATVAAGYVGKYQDSFHFVTRQILLGLLPGMVLFLVAAKLDYHFLKKWSWALYLITIVLLVIIFTTLGATLNDSRSWLKLYGQTFQPAELAKLVVIITSAYLLADTKRDWRDWKNQLMPILGVIGLPIALVIWQKDLGTGIVMIVIAAVLLVMARVPFKYLAMIGLIGLTLVTILIASDANRRLRFSVFFDPEADLDGSGLQVYQAKIAIGSGGFWGLGYGMSRQKYSYMPTVSSDAVFPVIAEELGFIGAAFLIGLIVLICWRGLKIAANAPDQFGQFVVVGIIVWFGWQSFVNIGGITGLIPLTGVPLPLVSHGGSAYMSILAGLGVVVSVSRQRIQTRNN